MAPVARSGFIGTRGQGHFVSNKHPESSDSPTLCAVPLKIDEYPAVSRYKKALGELGLRSNCGRHVYDAGRLNPVNGEYGERKPKLRGYARSGSLRIHRTDDNIRTRGGSGQEIIPRQICAREGTKEPSCIWTRAPSFVGRA